MRKIFIVMFTLCVVFSFTTAQADYYIKKKVHSDAMVVKGQQVRPAVDAEMEIWITKKKMAIVSEKQNVIYNKLKKKIYMLNHQKKQYLEMDLPLDMQKYMPQQMEAMYPALIFTVKEVKALKTKKKIKEWDCQGYKITMFNKMQNVEWISWTTQYLPDDITDFDDMGRELMKLSFPMNDEDYKKLLDIKGYSVQTEMNVTILTSPENPINLRIIDELVSVEEKKAPKKVFDIPKDYQKVDRLSMEDM